MKQAMALGAFDAVCGRVAAHAQNGAFQEEALQALSVLSHSGEGVPRDEGAWIPVLEAMKLHSGRGQVITVRGAVAGCAFPPPRLCVLGADERLQGRELGERKRRPPGEGREGRRERACPRRIQERSLGRAQTCGLRFCVLSLQEACTLLAVLACQVEPATADVAAMFTGELIAIVTRYHAHTPAAVSAACYALQCVIRSSAEQTAHYVRLSQQHAPLFSLWILATTV